MLLEVLVALLIFAVGVLGLVGLQANAIQQSTQAKYRADATLLANELIGQMRVSNRGFAGIRDDFSSNGNGRALGHWKTRVANVLPGADALPPRVDVEQIDPRPALVGAGASAVATGLTPSTRVTITLRWKAPKDASSGSPRSVVVVTEIK